MKYLSILIFLLIVPGYFACKGQSGFVVLDVNQKIFPLIVVPASPSVEESKGAQFLQSSFEKVAGFKIQLVKENTLTASQKLKSIVYVGKTNASVLLPATTLNENTYLIQQSKNAIYISGGGEKGLPYAIAFFAENFIGVEKLDERPLIYSKAIRIEMPSGYKELREPAFEFCQAYFPASNKEEYRNWHGLQHIEEWWGCWGHNLGNFLKGNGVNLPTTAYAEFNGIRKREQFCFTSTALHEGIKKALQLQLKEGNKLKYWSIAPNDNAIICQCPNCKKVNTEGSASEGVVLLLNKLAQDFPQLNFSTLAYATTIKPPKFIKMKPNTAVILSTIDFPKGIPLERQKQFDVFDELVNAWKSTCVNIMIWDYPIQYTNYMDVFPNLKSLQQDFQYFKRKGIKGIFEQGSGYDYSIFQEWKNYAIGKLAWNPDQDLMLQRTNFFNLFYGSAGQSIENFYQQCETNLVERNKSLEIYGNVQLSEKAYIDIHQLNSLLEKLHTMLNNETVNDPFVFYNIHKLTTCLDLLRIQIERNQSIGDDGYALASDEFNWYIKPESFERIAQVKKGLTANEIFIINEEGDSINTILNEYERFLKTAPTKNLIWHQIPTYNTPFDDSYPAKGKQTLTDGAYGTTEYSFNWLLFNNRPMDVLLQSNAVQGKHQLRVNFLHDPKHYIFLPKTIRIFDELGKTMTEQTVTEVVTDLPKIYTFTFPLMLNSGYFRIIANYGNSLPEWKSHPTKKPSIACDEINIQ